MMKVAGGALTVVLLALGLSWFLGQDQSDTPVAGVNRLVLIKHEHRLILYRDSQVIAKYRVALGRGGLGPKQQEGDNKVPEGTYRIVAHQPHSDFHNALRIGYPTASQAVALRARGVSPGGDIMIHGLKNGLGWIGEAHALVDWTRGCIGMTNSQIDRIAREVPDGTAIEIKP